MKYIMAILFLYAFCLSLKADDRSTRREQNLISAQDLHQQLKERQNKIVLIAMAKVFDFYWHGHIPNSLRVWRSSIDYNTYASPFEEKGVDGMLVSKKRFQQLMRSWGINKDSKVVIYDYKVDATRLWWAFKLYGFDKVALLNGGFQAWEKAGYPVERSIGLSPAPGNAEVGPSSFKVAGSIDIRQALRNSAEFDIWDTRSPEEWAQKKVIGNSTFGGNIKGSHWLNWIELKESSSNLFKAWPDIQRLMEKYHWNPDKKHIFYCQSGVRSTQLIFALYLMGVAPEKLLNYDGSWLEWSALTQKEESEGSSFNRSFYVFSQSVKKYEAYLRPGFFISIFLLFALLEVFIPRRKRVIKRGQRWPSNLALIFTGQLVVKIFYFLFPLIIPVVAAKYALAHEVGLFNEIYLHPFLRFALSIILLDCIIYWQHRIFHQIPFLWRIHSIHHLDEDLDVSSGIRFHHLEIFFSILIKTLFVALLGVNVASVICFEIILNATSLFNHSNIYLPKFLERSLRILLVTPDMHRIHHSKVEGETHSNFSFNFSLWDRLFGSYKRQPQKGQLGMEIGLPKNKIGEVHSLWELIKLSI